MSNNNPFKKNKFNGAFVPNLSLVVIVCMIIGYVLLYVFPGVYEYIYLSPYHILYEHQFWRLISWVFTVPYKIGSPLTAIFLPIAMYFYYRIGVTLEYVWGKRNYNLFIIGGVVFIDIFVMVAAVIMHFANPVELFQYANYDFRPNWYIMLSMYLAIAYVNPDMKILLYFVIPVKIKYMAYIDIAFLVYQFFVTPAIFEKVIITAASLNFLTFFLINLKVKPTSPSELKRRHEYRKKMKKAHIKKVYGNDRIIPVDQGTAMGVAARENVNRTPGGSISPTRHICAVCGRTELDNPDLEFRYCSKCEGTYEYCSDHLFTHQHVKKIGYGEQNQ